MPYDETHIGNKISSRKRTCPYCEQNGTDRDGYCVYCGEYVGNGKQRATKGHDTALMLGIINSIVNVIIIGLIAYILIFRKDSGPAPVTEDGQTIAETETNTEAETGTAEEAFPDDMGTVEWNGMTYECATVDRYIRDREQNELTWAEKYALGKRFRFRGKITEIARGNFKLLCLQPSKAMKYIGCNYNDFLRDANGNGYYEPRQEITDLVSKVVNGDVVYVYGVFSSEEYTAYFDVEYLELAE